MLKHTQLSDANLRTLIRQKVINYGGNASLSIYGTLHCKSGKRMKRENRVFFSSQAEAIQLGYRPCGHCMRTKYMIWKEACKHSK